MRQIMENKCHIFFVRLSRRENLSVDLSQVVIERSYGLSKKLERQGEGFWTERTCVRAVLDGLRGWEWQHNIMG